MIKISRTLHTHLTKRLYHDSKFSLRDPVIRKANSRIGAAIRERRDREVKPKVRDLDANKRLEPYPYAVTEDNKVEVIKRIISPLIDTPYEEQLTSKESHCRNSLRHFAQQLYKSKTPIRLDVRRLPCHVSQIVRAPKLYAYRNKDEFSIWRGVDGKTNTVGFITFPIGKHGDTICVEPNHCEVMKKEVEKVADILQEFIRSQAKLSVCYSLGIEGGWRRFTVRSNNQNELMLIGIASPRTLKVRDIIDERENYKNFVVDRAQQEGLPLRSLYFQPCPHNSCRDKDVPFELLYGDKTITETLNNLKFAISPESFIHQNSTGAEVLFRCIKDVIKECFSFEENSSKKPLVISANCGVGVASLHLADIAAKVIGVDNSRQAVDDAIFNASTNGIENCEFICSNLEIILERLLDKYAKYTEDILVICSPSKAGLHTNIIAALRNCSKVKKIIYVAPKLDASAVQDNLIELCVKKSGRALPPFAPIHVTPVDLYPHAESYESIVALERLLE